MLLHLVPLAAPLPLLAVALICVFSPGRRPRFLPAFAEWAAILSFAVACGAVGLLVVKGPVTSPLVGAWKIGLSARLDVVSVSMSLLVALIGWIVIRFTRTYLDGEARQGAFMGWLCAAVGSVLLLVQSGNIAELMVCWIAASFCVQKLLLFYPERAAARRAACKRGLFASLGAGALLVGGVLLAFRYGTTDIATINAAARSPEADPLVLIAAAFLGVAALLKSAQFPTHGWLTEVMEAPTPVSALLHAGVINAGGFLLIRFADVMVAAPGILAALAIVGGFTALFGSLVMLTQPAVKTSLAWSTVAQMGFMILQCGLALFSLALLYIVAHSLYKARAFLASGGAVQHVAAVRRPGPIAVPNALAVARAFVAALVIYIIIGVGFGVIFGLDRKSPQAFALGGILIFGVAYLLAQGFADAAPKTVTRKTVTYSVAVAIGYFALQTAAEWLAQGALPSPPAPERLEWTLMALAVLSFGLVAVAQALFPHWTPHPAASGLRVHLSNGLYINAVLDRVLGGWSLRNPS